MKLRLDPEMRRRHLVSVAVTIANERGLRHVSHTSVADACELKVQPGTVRHYFPKRGDLWSSVATDPAANAAVKAEAARLGITP